MKASINSLHHQETDWLRELEFYNDELTILRKRLGEVSAKAASAGQKTQFEEFQNKFNAIQKQMSALQTENKERYERVNQLAAVAPGSIEDEFTADRDVMYGQMSGFTSLFRKARFDLNAFVARLK